MNWCRLDLVSAPDALSDRLWRHAWKASVFASESHADSALFRRADRRARHVLFFSPGARDLGRVFGARPCKKPAPAGLILVAGSRHAWHTHFPAVPAAPDRSRLQRLVDQASSLAGRVTLARSAERRARAKPSAR